MIPPRLWWRIPGNALAFRLRQCLRWQRGMPALRGLPWEGALSLLPPERRRRLQARAESLALTYGLAAFNGRLHRRQWLKNLYHLDLLDRLVGPRLVDVMPPELVGSGTSLRALDVGTADWDYVFALHAFVCRQARTPAPLPCLSGIEVDGHGIYPDGYSRADYTRAYIAALDNPHVSLRYEDASKAEFPPQDLVFCFFPFVLPYQIVAWGLPLGLLQPEALLRRQAQWVRPGGYWCLFSHAAEERRPLRAHLEAIAAEAGFDAVAEGLARSDFEDDAATCDERWFWLFRRKPR